MTRIQECLAKNLKKYRKLRNLTQEQLGERAGTSTNYIGTIEIGNRFPSPQMLERLAVALEIDSLLLFHADCRLGDEPSLSAIDEYKSELKKNLLHRFNAVLDDVFST